MTRFPVLISNQPSSPCRPNDFPISAEITFFHTGVRVLRRRCSGKIAAGFDVLWMSQVERTVTPQILLGVIQHLAKSVIRLPEFLVQPNDCHTNWSFLKNLPKILFARF